jgi:hypothetical protein
MAVPPEVRRFADLAAAYCRLLGHLNEIPTIPERWRRLAKTLAALVDAAIDLPDLARTDRPKTHPEVVVPAFDVGDLDYYSVVFDPLELTDSPVGGSLVDDLQDIFRDLDRGLIVYRNGAEDDARDAAWEWRLHFSHWGQHATGALRALFWAITTERER